MKIQGSGEERVPSFYEYLLILLKYKWFIVLFVVVAFIGSVVVSANIPKEYSATTSIIPGDPEKVIGLLGSYRIRDPLIKRLEVEAATIDDARHKFNDMVTVRKKSSGIVTITVVDTDPERAANIANGMIEELDRFNRLSNSLAGKRARDFASQRLTEAKRALVEANEALLKFKMENPKITRATLAYSMGTSAKDYLVKRQLVQPTRNKTEQQIEDLKDEILGIKNMFVGLEVDEMKNKSDLMSSSDYAKLMLKYSWLMREAQVQQAIFNALSSQYQEAKLQEMQYVPTIVVLDLAKVPQKKSGPNKRLMVEASVVAAFLLSVFFVFLIEVVRKNSRKSNTV